MLKRLLAAPVVAAAMILSGASFAQETTLKVAVFIPEQAPTYSQVIKFWQDSINEEGKGFLRIDAFTGGSLGGNPAAQPDLVLDGVADAALVIPAYSPGRFPDNEVMELPGLMRNSTESSVAIRRLYDRGLLRGYDDFYVVLLSTTNPYAIHTTRPVKEIADIAGLKLRAGGPVAGAAVTALGAAPVGLPITQVAENVSKGVIDGTGGDWEVMYSFRIIEAAKHHFMVSLGTVPVAVLMNRKVYEGLSDKARALIDKHSGEILSRRFGKVHDGIQANGLERTKADPAHTIVWPSEKQLAEWDAIMAPVIDSWVKEHPKGKELLAALKEELAKIRAE
jgi:TRAP-type C4-dicarboxylate transport system substrate-binding protein